MEKNKTGKPASRTGRYLKYAIGEIILVVIGILIALSINNCNESKNNRNFEVKMLTEIKRSLISDLNDSERLLERVNKAKLASYKMLQNIYDNVTYQDSMHSDINQLIIGIQYQQTLGPYEAIKSVGLNKISNDSLRNHLITFYDFEYPRQKELILWYDKTYDKNFREINAFKEPAKIYRMGNDSINYRKRFSPSIFQNPDFVEYLTSVEMWSRNTYGVLKYIHPEMKKLIEEIELEINK